MQKIQQNLYAGKSVPASLAHFELVSLIGQSVSGFMCDTTKNRFAGSPCLFIFRHPSDAGPKDHPGRTVSLICLRLSASALLVYVCLSQSVWFAMLERNTRRKNAHHTL